MSQNTTYSEKWLRKATKDFNDTLEYKKTNSGLEAAQSLARKLFSAVDYIGQNPNTGRPGRFPGTREFVVPDAPYLIPFRVKGTEVQILRIFHCSRKPPVKSW